MSFVQRTSIVKRFQVLTVAFGLFLLLESAGTFIFSRTFLIDLRDLSRINAVTDYTARATDNITPAREMLEKLVNESAVYPRQFIPIFEASEAQAVQAIDSALDLLPRSARVQQLLHEARASVEELGTHSKIIFKTLPANTAQKRETVQKELLLIKQFELDAIEALRAVQIELTRLGNEIFSSVYQARLTPFLVSLFLALVFLGFVLYFGFTMSRKLKRSLDNLLHATEQVTQGNLNVNVPILSSDEIGRFTSAFALMVQNLKLSMEEAQKAVQIRDEFLSIASHELKTPITSLKMQLQFARRQIKLDQNVTLPPERLARIFDTSSTQVDRLTSLVEDLLDISRIESGKLSFHFERFDVCIIIKDVLERFADALRDARCEIKLAPCQHIFVTADPFRIEQVFVNLLSNAMKYSQGSLIEIAVVENNGLVRLSVRDHGMGIPEEKQTLIFNRFERVASDQNISGLGLGLYISKQIIEAHHGKIWVESAPTGGSIFIVEIPIEQTSLNLNKRPPSVRVIHPEMNG